MLLPEHTLHKPSSLDDCLQQLSALGEGEQERHDQVQLIAGGTDVIFNMRLKFFRPDHLVSLRRVPELQQVERLESFHELYFSPKPGRTVSRIVGWVLLVHEDSATIRRDREKIRELESCGFYEIESDD